MARDRRSTPPIPGFARGKSRPSGVWLATPTKRTLDAQGMVVAPGFIDMLGQSELTILVNAHLPSKIYQGITTEIRAKGLRLRG